MASAIVSGMEKERDNGNLRLWGNEKKEPKNEEERIEKIEEEITGIPPRHRIIDLDNEVVEKGGERLSEVIEFDQEEVEKILNVGDNIVDQRGNIINDFF